MKTNIRIVLGWLTICVGIMSVLLIGQLSNEQKSVGLFARLLPAHMRYQTPWKTLKAEDIHSGISAPAHTNIIFSLPYGMPDITRRTLFGRKGSTVRYWGYCFPEDYDEAVQEQKRYGLPGKIFLSEMEQTLVQMKIQEQQRERFTVFRNLDENDLNEANSFRGLIRHQKEIFEAGETCYLMTETPLPMGLDEDDDGVNSRLEMDNRTSDRNQDSDGDGIKDGLEIFKLGTSPIMKDSDGDGLPDGMEDKNQNGLIELGETSPTQWDSDRDGLCDGFCVVQYNLRTGFSAPDWWTPEVQGKIVWEDKNLNGIVDENETDPLKVDTDGDGILDSHEFYNCILLGNTDC